MPVIATTFAGRRDRMDLLVAYLISAIDAGVITEYHVWDYARTDDDRRWLRELPRRHPAIRLFTPTRHGSHYGEYYRHYQQDAHGDAVFLKLDDDIVYLDLERLAEFVDFRTAHPECFLVSASVINNGVCAYFQQQRGLIPESLMHLPYPERGFCGTLWERADLAERLHDFFLDDPARFIAPGTDVAPDRLSINCVSYLGRDLEHLQAIGDDDEEALSVTIPQQLGRTNVVYQPMVAAHLSFFSQDAAMDTHRVLARYRALAEARGVLGHTGQS